MSLVYDLVGKFILSETNQRHFYFKLALLFTVLWYIICLPDFKIVYSTSAFMKPINVFAPQMAFDLTEVYIYIYIHTQTH